MRSKRTFDFVKTSRRFLIISAIITLLGIVIVSISGLNYGIDFSSGTSMDISTKKPVTEEKLRAFLDEQKIGEYTLTTAENRDSIRFKEALNENQEKDFKAAFSAQIDPDASYEINIVDVDIAREQQQSALIGMAIACLGIVIYVSIRFEWRFAISAVVSLIYSAFFVITMFSIFRLEVNLPFILAVLTIIGYAINDTVVIFDRIRENLRFAKIKTAADLDALVNKSVWQTLSRSINTVITVLIASVCLFIFGSESIKLFSLAMIFGLVAGAYSSIFIASQLWLYLKKRQPIKKVAVKPQSTP
ncbi:protein translocase subunit SecF [Cohnella luojiensis]|uniref:Protein-export membrane protein SecF n=1 Tax=Cohnella luojiensis TaxID=652876 RepID=A0A4Y8M7M2_9BACL|nr:protein translocase subunit SecF [Cohnella luojiensis]TFE30729.1 protein translocase subunit SecF [Cohnella luojiensis]